jgi:hypothetical protein
MKTIELSDEMYDKLIELATEMTTQDPRGTRMPHMFQVRSDKRVYDWGLNGHDQIWIDCSNSLEIESAKDFISYLDDMGVDRPSDDDLIKIWKDPYSTIEWKNRDYDISDFIEDFTELKACSVSEEPEYSNCFFTAKACKEHIMRNGYHYRSPVDYLNHAWRNPEMDLVSEFLCQLVGKKMHT